MTESCIIDRVDTFRVDYDVIGDFRFLRASGAERVTRPTMVVRVTDVDGRCGWGQCVPSPSWSYETIESVQSTLQHYLAPAIQGCDAFDGEQLQMRMHRAIAPSFSTGQPICKAGLQLAVFDLTGRVLKQSAAQRWGKSGADHITLSWTIDAPTIDDLSAQVEAATQRGFRHYNVKIGRDAALDVHICRRLRQLRADAFIWADANGGYDLETALAVAPQLAELNLAALEQPVPANRLSWFSRLKQQAALPILMDEAVLSCADLEEFHRLNLLDGVAMKVARCGGLDEAQRMMEYLRQHGLLLFGSGLTDPDLSLAASLLLFSAYGMSRPAALNAPQLLTGSILATPIEVQADQARVPQGPGLGVEIDLSQLTSAGHT